MFQWLPRPLAIKVKIQSPKRSSIIWSLLTLWHELPLLSSWFSNHTGLLAVPWSFQTCPVADFCTGCFICGNILPPSFCMAIRTSFHTQISLTSEAFPGHRRSDSNSHPAASPAFLTLSFSIQPSHSLTSHLFTCKMVLFLSTN